MAARILLIEDDEKLAELVQLWIEQAGHHCERCADGTAGLRLAMDWQPDLLILDLSLPGTDGWQICRRLRESGQVPIIMVTARGEEVDRVRGLRLGADDYVVKPFSFPELLARVDAILRRAGGVRPAVRLSVFRKDALEVDLEAHRVRVGRQEVRLTPTEFRLLAYMVEHQGRLLTHRQLLQAVWGPEYGDDLDSLRMYVHALRQKIELPATVGSPPARYIATEYGLGYRFG